MAPGKKGGEGAEAARDEGRGGGQGPEAPPGGREERTPTALPSQGPSRPPPPLPPGGYTVSPLTGPPSIQGPLLGHAPLPGVPSHAHESLLIKTRMGKKIIRYNL